MSSLKIPRFLSEPTTTLPVFGPFIALCVALVTVTGIMLLAVYLNRISSEHRRQDAESPFCCEDDARELARSVNHLADPCGNFYGYICSAQVDGVSPEVDFRQYFEHVISTGAQLAEERSQLYLRSLFRGCINTVWRSEVLLQQLISAILRTLAIKKIMTTDDVLRGIVTSGLSFTDGSWFGIRQHTSGLLWITCGNYSFVRHADGFNYLLDASVAGFNANTGGNVTNEEVEDLISFLGMSFTHGAHSGYYYSPLEIPEAFGAHLHAWNRSLMAFGGISLTTIPGQSKRLYFLRHAADLGDHHRCQGKGEGKRVK